MVDNRYRGLRAVLRIAISALFLLSAAAKLVGIDQFELYVYSFGLLPFNACTILARLCIAAEAAVGLWVAVGWWPRAARLTIVGLLAGFSVFLCYALLAGRNDSCQCFGQWADIPPAQSLLKNALLLLLVLLYYRLRFRHAAPPSPRRWHRWVALGGAVACLAAVFSLSVPDCWLYGRGAGPYNREAFADALAPDGALQPYALTNGPRLVAFLTPGCPYCRMSRQKIGYIAERHHLADSSIVYILPDDIGQRTFLDITYGMRPLVMLVDSGRVVATYHYRNINEREIVAHLSGR